MKIRKHIAASLLAIAILLASFGCASEQKPTIAPTGVSPADPTTAAVSQTTNSGNPPSTSLSGNAPDATNDAHDPNQPLTFALEEYPKIDGSTATIPLSEAFMATLTGKTVEEIRLHLKHNKTHSAYVNLIEKKADLIFVTYPSVEEQQLAASSGVELEIVPIVREGFVFLTNRTNPVDSLTRRQIIDIYTGAITDWSEVGGTNGEIRAFQRPVNSGSQSGFLELVMKDATPMEPPKELEIGTMGMLIDKVASFDSGNENAIGYSYYYYATDMWKNEHVKLLAIDGIEPNAVTISDESYPYCTAYYAVLRKDTPEHHPARQLLQWILSDSGQQVAKDAGYVRLKEGKE